MAGFERVSENAWMDEDPSRMGIVEDWIFSSALSDYDFWLSVADRVCLDPYDGSDIDDFDKHERNIAFSAVRKFIRTMGTSEIPAPDALGDFLKQEAKSGNLCMEEEIPGVMDFYRNCTGKKVSPSVISLAGKFLPPWLSRKRAKLIGNQSRRMTLDELVTAGERHSDVVSSICASDTDIVLYGNHPRFQEDSGAIQLRSLPRLSTSLGGFYRGDAYLFQAQSGAGKTVMSVQMLVDFVSQNMKGIFISTEQPWKEIEPRIISNATSIDIGHDALKNRFDYERLKSEKFSISKVDEWEAMARGKFVFFHWSSDNTQSVKTDLEATLRKGKSLLGDEPDFVILDWIGGALGSDTNSDNLRFTYQTTADAFAAACLKHRFIGIAFAQSKADKVYYSLGSEQLAECKTMHRKFAGLVGITAIPVKDDQGGAKSKYEKTQYLDVSKSRKGDPARIGVTREFGFQKFIEHGRVV